MIALQAQYEGALELEWDHNRLIIKLRSSWVRPLKERRTQACLFHEDLEDIFGLSFGFRDLVVA